MMTNPLDKLSTILARHMGKEPSDPDVLEAVVEVVMAMREPSEEMVNAAVWTLRSKWPGRRDEPWEQAEVVVALNAAMIDALLT